MRYSAFVALIFAAPLSAQTVTITGGAQDLTNVPVSVAVAGEDRIVSVNGEIGQVSGGVLYFVMPKLPARQTKTLQLAARPKLAPTFFWKDTPGRFMELTLNDRPLLRYVYEPLDESSKARREATFKVFHHLYSPDGTRMVTKGVGGRYTHHRGLFYGFNKTTYGDKKLVDTWHCTNDTYLSHEKVIAELLGPVVGGHVVEIAWHGVKKEVFAKERRTLAVWNVPNLAGTLVEFASTLTPTVPGVVKLDGDPQHAGFHFRADNEVDEKTKSQTYYLRPDGQGKPGETRNWEPKTKKGPINLPWNAMSFVIGDTRYTAVYLDHPDNPKEARYSERDYGRFGSYFEATATAEKPLQVRYRLYLAVGELTQTQCEALSATFTQPKIRPQ